MFELEGKQMNDSAQYPRTRWLVLLAAVLGGVAMQAVNVSIAPLLPEVAKSLNVGLGTATNLMSVFLFSSSVVILFVGGAVSDRFGPLVSIILGLICLTIPAVLTPWIGAHYAAVFWARMVEGLSCGFILPAGGPILAIWFPRNERGMAGGALCASISIGSMVGLLSGPAVFSVTKDWKTMSALLSIPGWVTLLFALALAFFCKRRLLIDVPGATANIDATFKRALLAPLTLFGVLVTFASSWCTQCLYSLTPAFLAADKPVGAGYGAMVSGQLMIAVTVAGIVGPMICGFLLDKIFHGRAIPMMLLGFVLASGCCYALLLQGVMGSVPILEAALLLAGLGVQFVFPAITVFIVMSYPGHIVGKATGLWNGLGFFGGVIGLYIGGVTVGRTGSYHSAILSMAICALVGFFLALVLRNQKSLTVPQPEEQAVHVN
jgi:MFS family permease